MSAAGPPPLPTGVDASTSPLYKIPIRRRPATRIGPQKKYLFPPLFLLGMLAVNAVQLAFTPVWLVRELTGLLGLTSLLRECEKVLQWGREFTKVMFGGLIVTVTLLFAPTSLTITSDGTIDIDKIVHYAEEEVSRNGSVNGDASLTKRETGGGHSRWGPGRTVAGIELPENLIVIANHQAYLDWMYIWILGHLSCSGLDEQGRIKRRHHGSQSLVVLLKRSLKWLPIVGWGMQFYRFIFMHRSWAADRQNLTAALHKLGEKSTDRTTRSGLWLLIFPEGTITSDEERAKSRRYADREGVLDFINVLHPRATGVLFCTRTLLPKIPNLKILDITIGYPGVPRGGYAQEWYNLFSVFYHSVPPPTVHMHLRMVDPTSIPGVRTGKTQSDLSRTSTTPSNPFEPQPMPELASEEEAKAFNLWLRGRWQEKEALMDTFTKDGSFVKADAQTQKGALSSTEIAIRL